MARTSRMIQTAQGTAPEEARLDAAEAAAHLAVSTNLIGAGDPELAAFFTGSLLIETLFSLDGLGLLSYESVIRRDYPVVFGSLYVFTIIGLLTTLIRDLSYLWVDPRVKFFD